MYREQAFSKKRKEADIIRWRGHEVLRVEAFSDAVFAFAVTLLIVSLEVPGNFEELWRGMLGFFPFAFCFIIIFQVWLAQNLYFRRFGLHDDWTLVLNGMLLFVVLFFVYPLKFLSTHIMIVHQPPDIIGKWKYLFYIYNGGFFTIYMLLTLLYFNALKHKHALELTDHEAFEARTYAFRYLGICGVTLLSSVIASFGDRYAFFAGISYTLIGPVIALTHHKRGKIHRKKFGTPAKDAGDASP